MDFSRYFLTNPRRGWRHRFRFSLTGVLSGILWSAGCGTLAVNGLAQSPVLSVGAGNGAQIELSWPVTPGGYRLERAERLTADTGWAPVAGEPSRADGRNVLAVDVTGTDQYFRLQELPASAATTLSSSPADGEAGVSVNRETVLEFSAPLAAGTLLGSDVFRAEFGGRPLLTRLELSSDRRRASLFYLEPLPARARVLVTFDGDRVNDEAGGKVDADGDGIPGGVAQIRFDTMSSTPVAGTAVIGHVYAAEAGPGGNGMTNRPLQGVTVTVDGAEEVQRAVTDASGFFRLSPSPTGRFFVHVDGRTAVGSSWPGGDYYPVVGKPFEAAPGVATNLAGGTGEIFLPLVRAGTLQGVSPTQPTVVGFPAAVVAGSPELAGTSVTVPANSLFADDGSRGGRLGIAPVPPDRLPTPLPEGLNFPLVITVQTDGPLNLDVPAAVRFPNLPDPVTGLKLGPGEKSALWSYDHDSGRWELQGSVTVTADGNFVESDPGVGIRQPGWHGITPGNSGSDGGGDDDDDDDGDPCAKEQQAVEDALFGCALSAALELAELAPGLGCAISISSSIISTVQSCSDPESSCAAAFVLNSLFGAAGCVPALGLAAGAVQCALQLGMSLGDLAACEAIHSEGGMSAPVARLVRPAALAGFPENPMDQQIRISTESRSLLVAVLGDERWVEASSADPVNMRTFGTALTDALSPASESGNRLSAAERVSLLALPAPAGLNEEVRSALLDRLDRFSAGGITAAETDSIRGAATALNETALELQQRGWASTMDGFKDTAKQTSADFERRRAAFPVRRRALFYRLDDLTSGVVRRGRTDNLGRLRSLPLQSARDFAISYVDPKTLATGVAFFGSGPAGTTVRIPRARMAVRTGPDRDGDGLLDQLEAIVGTDPDQADTDGDGASDLVEVQSGQNPLDGLALPEGIVAGAPLGGRAYGLCVDDDTAYVANGTAGLALVDVADPLSPVRLGGLDLEGECWDVAYAPGQRVAGLIARPEPGTSGDPGLLHFVDVANPNALVLRRSLAIPVSAIEHWNGLFYVALGQFTTREVRIYDPGTALEIGSLSTVDYPNGLLVTGGLAYVSTGGGLEIHDVTTDPPVRLARLAGSLPASPLGKVHLVLDGTTLFIGKSQGPVTVDVSDPANPTFLGLPATSPAPLGLRAIALDGGGRMVSLSTVNPGGSASAAPNLTVYDVSERTNVNAVLFSLPPVNRSRDLAVVNGLALVADDLAGLSVVNYAGIDSRRVPPTIEWDPVSLDVDPAKPGVQVIAGGVLHLAPIVRDDQRIHRTELYVDDVLVASAREYPAAFDYPLPAVSGTAGPQTLSVRIRTVDSSALVAETAAAELELVPDAAGPGLFRSIPDAGGVTFPGAALAFEFSEQLGAADISRASLTFLGADGSVGGSDDVEVALSSFAPVGAMAYLAPAAVLAPGRYQVTWSAGAVQDRSGNPVTDGFAATFEVMDERPDSAIWISDADGSFSDPANWLNGHLPVQSEAVLRRFGARPTVTVDGTATIRSLRSELAIVVTNRGNLFVQRDLVVTEPVTIAAGNLTAQGNASFEQSLAITGGTLTANGRLEFGSTLSLSGGGSLSFDGAEAQLVLGGAIEAVNCTISVRNGAVLELPQFVTFESPGDFSALFAVGAAFRAQGAGSRLTLPNLVSANGPVDWNVRGIPSLRFEAVSGGELILPKLTTLTGRTLLSASGTGGRLTAPVLSAVTGPDSQFGSAIEPSSSGRIEVPALARIDHGIVTLRTDGVLAAEQLEIAETSGLAGAGVLEGNVVNRGTLTLNQATGSLRVDGDLELVAGSAVDVTVGLGGTREDAGRLEVSGQTSLEGTLTVVKAGGYTPAAGQEFLVGSFANPPAGTIPTVDSTALGELLKAEAVVTASELRVHIGVGP